MLLPFCGVINSDWCNGVRLNYGIYTQCTNNKDKSGFCKTCYKQGEKNGTGVSTYGTIQDRAAEMILKIKKTQFVMLTLWKNLIFLSMMHKMQPIL